MSLPAHSGISYCWLILRIMRGRLVCSAVARGRSRLALGARASPWLDRAKPKHTGTATRTYGVGWCCRATATWNTISRKVCSARCSRRIDHIAGALSGQEVFSCTNSERAILRMRRRSSRLLGCQLKLLTAGQSPQKVVCL
jgi:hypothetical protein